MSAAQLPPLPHYNGNDPALRQWTENLVGALELWSRRLAAPAGEQWTVNGTTAQRDIDPAVLTTLPEVVNALGTLLQDLSKGAPMSVTG